VCRRLFNFFNNLGDFISRFSEVVVAVHTSIIVALIVLVIQNWCPQNIILTITFELTWILYLIGAGTGTLRTRRGEMLWGAVVAASVSAVAWLLCCLLSGLSLQQQMLTYWEVMWFNVVCADILFLIQIASILAVVTRKTEPSTNLLSVSGHYWFCQWCFIATLLFAMLRSFLNWAFIVWILTWTVPVSLLAPAYRYASRVKS